MVISVTAAVLLNNPPLIATSEDVFTPDETPDKALTVVFLVELE
jgi:hypothetical protein